MRPAVLPVETCSPSCSGRGLQAPERSLGWRRTPRSVVAASLHGAGQRAGGQPAAAAARAVAPPATRTAAYSASLPLPGSGAAASAAASTTTEAPSRQQQQQQQQQEQQQQQQKQPPLQQLQGGAPARRSRSLLDAAEGQASRDGDGLVRQRLRPLKINLDLALVGAGACDGRLGIGAREGVQDGQQPHRAAPCGTAKRSATCCARMPLALVSCSCTQPASQPAGIKQ